MVHLTAGSLDQNNDTSRLPSHEAGLPDMAPQPEFSAPIPGPQPGFSHDSESNLHQIHHDDLYAPGPVPAKYDHEPEYDAPDPVKPQPAFSVPIPGPQPLPEEYTQYDDLHAPNPATAKYNHPHGYIAPPPLKSQPTFSAPIPGPLPGFFQEPQSGMHYQPAQPAKKTEYDAPYAPSPAQVKYHHQQGYEAPLKPTPEFSAPVLGPQPGFFPDHGHYQPTNDRGPSPNGYTPVRPHAMPTEPVPINPQKIQIVQQPMQLPQVQIQSYNVPWTTGLFDFCDDPSSAIVTLCVPCVTFGQAAEIIDQGSTTCATHAMFYSFVWCFTLSPCILSCSYRTKLRAKYNLMESPATDCLTHVVCELCALCQMHRELVNRGIDPSIGWLGNAQRMQQQQQKDHMAPPPHQAMM